MPPAGVAAEQADGADVAGDEHGQDDAGGLEAGEQVGEEHHVEEADSREAALGHADADGRPERRATTGAG
jgi:hypothetical protein